MPSKKQLHESKMSRIQEITNDLDDQINERDQTKRIEHETRLSMERE